MAMIFELIGVASMLLLSTTVSFYVLLEIYDKLEDNYVKRKKRR